MPSFNKNDFSGNPVRLDIARSRFAMPFKHKTTFNAGLLVPVFSYGDVLPGDSFSVDLSCLVRMATPVFPVMDDCYMDVYFFFTPHKLSLSRQSMSPAVNDGNHSWNAFIGAQDSLLNMPVPSEITLPMVFLGANGAGASQLGSLTDYLGLPVGGGWHSISCLEPLAYYQVWNNYFRDENTMNPVVFSISGAYTNYDNPLINNRNAIQFSGFDGTTRWGNNGSNIGATGSILPVCRPHGYFGSALPWPQRNLNMMEIPLIGAVPVVDQYGHTGNGETDPYIFDGFTLNAAASATGTSALDADEESGSKTVSVEDAAGNVLQGIFGATHTVSRGFPSWLSADLSNVGIAVNALRLSVQVQRFYEALARGGNRIGEISSSMFGVTPSDFAQDRPEYLGGKRIPISMDQVTSTNGDTTNGNLGALGAYSNTGDSSHYFTKSFDTWGTLTCVVCVRTNESFTQGIHRRYTRKSRFDFYWPQFANLGEQPILRKEIYVPANSYSSSEEEVFGYQEAWAEYRYLPDIVSGHLRPTSDMGFATYANLFTEAPTLAGYIDGTAIRGNIDRTLAVSSESSGFQFIGDFAFNIIATRPMPRYSIPGLVDHH